MKKRLLFSALFSMIYLVVAAQCNFPASPSTTCATAPVICPIDGYCSTTSGANAIDLPTTFCGSIQNNQWLAFIPTSTDLTIDLIVGNCSGLADPPGIQAEVFSVCGAPWTPASNCVYQISPNNTEQLVMKLF